MSPPQSDALMAVATSGPKRHHPIGPKDEALRLARTCYDHIAGRLAIALADALVDNGYVVLAEGAGLVTDEGRRIFCEFGIDRRSARLQAPVVPNLPRLE